MAGAMSPAGDAVRPWTLKARRYDGRLGEARVFCTWTEACARAARLRRNPKCALAWVESVTPAKPKRCRRIERRVFVPAPVYPRTEQWGAAA
jgi:hypothetical protein